MSKKCQICGKTYQKGKLVSRGIEIVLPEGPQVEIQLI
jgi:hypothetical protein